MKKTSILMLALAAAFALACSGDGAKYDISGINAPVDGARVLLIDRISDTPIDSAVVANGAFQMKGKADKDAFLRVDVEGWEWMFPLFNDGKAVKINLADSTVTGSPLNVKLSDVDRQGGAILTDLNEKIQAFLALPEAEQQAQEEAFTVVYQDKVDEYIDFLLQAIEDNKDNLIPVSQIEAVPSLVGYDKFDELMASGAPFTQHPYVVNFKNKVDESSAEERAAEKAKNAVIGQKFIDLEEADPNGKMHKLSEYVGQGNWVLVDFWASWCGPCKAEMPNVVEAYKKYHPKGFQIVGVSFDRDKEPWVKAIKDWEMPWIHISDLKYWKNAASELYSVNAIPDNLLIDPEGTVVARGLRGKELQAKLASIYE
ncbi:MAG: AhpC/TSA family protein [Bacteroidales bacterium]|nr:AhpC/TSA family protein [Bacteroidales bacterium]